MSVHGIKNSKMMHLPSNIICGFIGWLCPHHHPKGAVTRPLFESRFFQIQYKDSKAPHKKLQNHNQMRHTISNKYNKSKNVDCHNMKKLSEYPDHLGHPMSIKRKTHHKKIFEFLTIFKQSH